MKTWIEERDLFIAETTAFVKEVAASSSAPASAQTVVAAKFEKRHLALQVLRT